MSTSTPAKTKAPQITIDITVTCQGKENMTLDELAAAVEKARSLKGAAEAHGAVIGTIAIGKQKFPL